MRHHKRHPLFREFTQQHIVTKSPLTNLTETDDSYTLSVAAPGLSKKDFDISLEEYVITITANQEGNDTETLRREEYDYGNFTKKIKLPKDVDKTGIKANYKHGVLSITLPRNTEAVVSKSIEIH